MKDFSKIITFLGLYNIDSSLGTPIFFGSLGVEAAKRSSGFQSTSLAEASARLKRVSLRMITLVRGWFNYIVVILDSIETTNDVHLFCLDTNLSSL